MNSAIKFTVFVWLLACALVAWMGCAVVGFFCAFSNISWMYNVTPFIGLTIAIVMIKAAFYVLLKSNPKKYLKDKYVSLIRYIKKV